MEYTKARKRLVDWLRQQLIGPAGKDGLIGASPLYRYPAGVLYPVDLDVPSGIDPATSGGDADSASLEDEEEEAPMETGDESGGRTASVSVTGLLGATGHDTLNGAWRKTGYRGG